MKTKEQKKATLCIKLNREWLRGYHQAEKDMIKLLQEKHKYHLTGKK
jgi:hypothetical protein